MEIIIAKTAGFCFGVERAVNLAYNQSYKKNVYTYGPIIHNSDVVNSLSERGIKEIACIDNIEDKSTIIIRSHGVTSDVYSQAKDNNIKIIDATCPYVKKIHKIVQRHSKANDTIVIVGNKEHPEVIGIKGWASKDSIIVSDVSELSKLRIPDNKAICIVCQTTYRHDKFREIVDWIEERHKNVKIYDTICNATSERQAEAIEIAKQVDYMIVIGDKKSSNTQKLYEVSKKYCRNTVSIENADELELNNLKYNDRIGMTAGASTPDGTIEEVVLKMQHKENNEVNEENMSFAELYAEHEETRLRKGQIVMGRVIGITQDDEVAVDLGHKFDGIISKNELSADPNIDVSEVVEVGEEIEVYVSRINDAESTVVLSKRRVDSVHGWKHIEKAYKEQTVLTGTVSVITKGGVIVPMHGTNIFIPISLLAGRYIEDLSEFKDKEIQFQIIEIEARRRRVIGNRKALLMDKIEKRKDEVLETLEVGKRVTGTVKNITGYGIFVDLEGIDGFAHISNLSWKHIKSPKEVVKIGQEIEVEVLEIDMDNKKVSLTMKFDEDNPWTDIEEKYPAGSVVEGKVVRTVPFGAFVEIEEGLEALLHISQISTDHVEKVESVLSVGETIEIKILQVDTKSKRINVSRKALLEETMSEEEQTEVTEDEVSEETE
ncbi:MAG: bifunctional 4-hydroxy-3-methylbut-2-enyl diphosphate reductase/30S ribosomal protein S1 [Epulopiscium sp.]|nr:bifunctional 4-hydroxy-3-methylbut-2-enyl diphosphate reductase/30S ribosomal protein S1 [Candidatus Epulonipiscium sp.]